MSAGAGRRIRTVVPGAALAVVLAVLLPAVLLPALSARAGEAGDDPLAALGLTAPRERRPAPAFRLESLADGQAAPAGDRVALGDQAGRLVLVNFWATWCEPCVKELPALDALARDLGNRGLTVLAVNVDRGRRSHVTGYAERLGLTVPVLLDRDGAVRRAYQVRALPTTYLIGRDGRISGRVLGERPWDDAAHRAALEALLGEEAGDAGPPPPETHEGTLP
jgi:thiol-disulfide isomerase/thioredoxin